MELWLDTHATSTVQRAKDMGVLHGITTNPSIVASSGRPLRALLDDFLSLQAGPVAVQVVGTDVQEMLRQAKALWGYSQRLMIKVPVTEAGLICMYRLAQEGIPVLATALFEPQQALLACKAGASYLAPYVGRIRDQGVDPWAVLKQMVEIKRHYGFNCKILGAGLRTKEDFNSCASLGLCSVTIPEKIFNPLFQPSEGMAKALSDFTNDWQRAEPTHIF